MKPVAAPPGAPSVPALLLLRSFPGSDPLGTSLFSRFILYFENRTDRPSLCRDKGNNYMSRSPKDHAETTIAHVSRRIVFVLIAASFLLPSFGHALTLQEGLRIVTESGRDVAIARSEEDAARGAVSL